MERALRSATELLANAGVERPRWTAEQLLSRRLDCLPLELYLEPPPLGEEERNQFQADVAARASHVPLQYLLQSASFYGREFQVGPGVFIPRPETEVLVEGLLELLGRSSTALCTLPSVADIGTGCGAIAVTLALECPGLKIIATDISSLALSFAQRNADRFGAKLSLLKADLAQGFGPNSIDWMIANLPYLDSKGTGRWPKELRWEPWLALSGGTDGISLIQRLIVEAIPCLRPGGRLVLEMAHDQRGPIAAFVQGTPLRVERVIQDLNRLDRVMVLWKG